MGRNLRIAAYMRLSKVDEGGKAKEESNSISMQRILIYQYIASHFAGCQILEYLDDGFSGVSFKRPGVQRLLEDAKNEKLDCIIVKDFSRFGRDYMEVGAYLEQIFPFLGIRFISINDSYDSISSQGGIGDLDVNFKNLLYDFYSKDLSQKVKASLRARKESGQYVSANAPFGYEKAADDRHMLVVCEDEAEVVRRVFGFALQGMTSSQTAKRLNLENVPAPVEFKIRKGKTSRKPKGDKFYWSSSIVCSILRNPVYIGDVEYGKTEKEQVGGRNVLKAKADWKVVRNHHAPIITREVFWEVQKNRGRSSRKERGKNKHLLAGKLACSCCKHKLRFKEGLSPYFTCYNRYTASLEGCVIKADAASLEHIVLLRLGKYLEEQGFAAELNKRYLDNLEMERASLIQEIKRAKQEYERMEQVNFENYRLYSLGEQEKFYSSHAEIGKQQEVIQKLQKQITQMDKQICMNQEKGLILGENAELTSEIIGQHIDIIIVSNNGKIEIRWKTRG